MNNNNIVIDTNALVLLILGTIDKKYIGKHKHISAYSIADYDYLLSVINASKKVITCPNVLTEVDNLCNREVDKHSYSQIFKQLTEDYEEKYKETKKIVNDNLDLMWNIGLTDIILIKIAKECDFLITGDSKLSDHAKSQGIAVIDLKERANKRILNN